MSHRLPRLSPLPSASRNGRSTKRKGVKRSFDVIIERDETGWFVATVPALRGCISQGKTLAEAKRNVVEAIALCLADEDGSKPQNEFLGVHRVEVMA